MIMIDIDMPDNCDECRFNTEYDFCKAMPDNFCGNTDDKKRPEWCPLKEQEAVKPEREHSGGGTTWWNVCGNCKTAINPNDKFCHECGKPVKWDDNN